MGYSCCFSKMLQVDGVLAQEFPEPSSPSTVCVSCLVPASEHRRPPGGGLPPLPQSLGQWSQPTPALWLAQVGHCSSPGPLEVRVSPVLLSRSAVVPWDSGL